MLKTKPHSARNRGQPTAGPVACAGQGACKVTPKAENKAKTVAVQQSGSDKTLRLA